MSRPPSSSLQKLLSFCLVLLACLAYVAFRIWTGNDYTHPDESIPLKVIKLIGDSGRWDTNWNLVPDLHHSFKYNQYNFSSYIVTAAVLMKLSGKSMAEFGNLYRVNNGLNELRLFSAVYHVAAVVLAYHVGRVMFSSRRVGVAASWLLALSPLLFQDSLYVRPESFVTMLVLLLMLAFLKRDSSSPYVTYIALGALLGFLIACKVTFVALLALPALSVAKQLPDKRRCALLAALVVAGLFLGFVAGAPYALVNFTHYLNGINALFRQYGGEFPPHSIPGSTVFDRVMHSWKYFTSIGNGMFFVAAVAGWLLLLKEKLYEKFLVITLFFLVVAYFSAKTVFFERNMSFAMPYLGMAGAYALVWVTGKIPWSQRVNAVIFSTGIVAIMLPLLIFLYIFNTQVIRGAYIQQHREMRAKVRQQFADAQFKDAGWVLEQSDFQAKVVNELPKDGRGAVFELKGANDHYSRRYVALSTSQYGMRLVGEALSPLERMGMPTSTMYVYHAPHYFYLLSQGGVTQ